MGNGAVYRFAYDDMDRLASEIGPDGREQQYRYDGAGQLVERIEANGPDGQPLATRYSYDAAGRLTARHLPATEHAPPAPNTTAGAPTAPRKRASSASCPRSTGTPTAAATCTG
ncbi:hypothetical protein [Vreelandella sp. GE22]